MIFGIILLFILALIVVVFTLQNTHITTINFLFWELQDIPLALIIFSCILTGALIAVAICIPKLFRLKRANKKLNKDLQAAHTKLAEYSINESKEQVQSSSETTTSIEKKDIEGEAISNDNEKSFFDDGQ